MSCLSIDSALRAKTPPVSLERLGLAEQRLPRQLDRVDATTPAQVEERV